MSHPIVTNVSLAAADDNGISTTQTLPGASGLSAVLNGVLVTGGVALLGAPRRVVVHSNGNDSGLTFTVTGTRGTWWAQTAITETIAGADTDDAVTTQDFLTVTSVVASGATASSIIIGTNEVGSGPWVAWDSFATTFDVSIYGLALTGSTTWKVEVTYDDVFGTWLPAGVPFPRAIDSTITSKTTAFAGNLTSLVRASRLTITDLSDGAGSAQLIQQQLGS